MEESLLNSTKKQIETIYKNGNKPSEDPNLMRYMQDISRTLNYINNVIENDNKTITQPGTEYKKGFVPERRFKYKNENQVLMNPFVKLSLNGNSQAKPNLTQSAVSGKATLLATRETVNSNTFPSLKLEQVDNNNNNNLKKKHIVKNSPLDKECIIEYL